MSGAKPAAVPESGASNSSTKHLGPLQQGFKRQNEMASSRPPAPKSRKLAKPKATLPIPAAVALDKPEPLPIGASTSHGDEAFRTALSASSSANSASHVSGSGTSCRSSLLPSARRRSLQAISQSAAKARTTSPSHPSSDPKTSASLDEPPSQNCSGLLRANAHIGTTPGHRRPPGRAGERRRIDALFDAAVFP